MKSVHHYFVTKEDKEKMPHVGNTTQSIKFTKADYLSPSAVAKKFSISTDKARNVMKALVFKRATFAVNGHLSPIITQFNQTNKTMYLHPLAIDAFKKLLEEQKD